MSETALTGALALLADYNQGFAFLANAAGGRGQVAVKDTGTPANNLSNAAAPDLITNAGTSPKLVKQQDGTYAWSPHNLSAYSEDLTQWTAARVTLAADEITETTDTNSHFANVGSLTTVSGATYTSRYRVKKGDGATAPDVIQVVWSSSGWGADAWQNFNIANGTVGTGGSAVTSSISDAGDGWYDVVVSAPATTSTTTTTAAIVFTNNNDGLGRLPSYAGATTSNVFAKHIQLNRGTTPTTYVPTTTAAVFEPAFEWDSTYGASGGWRMLVEPAAANLLVYSQDFDNAAYTKSNVTIDADAVTAPDGTTTADTATDNTTNAGHIISDGITLALDTTATFSVFVKPGTHNFPFIAYQAGSEAFIAAVFDLSDTSATSASETDVGTTSGTIVSTFQEYDSQTGWFRIGITGSTSGNHGIVALGFAAAADTTNNFNNTGYPRYAGTGTTLHFWGAQAELGTVATSPIPTYGATVTRSADQPKFATSLIPFSATEGTVVAQYEVKIIGGSVAVWQIESDGSNAIYSLATSASHLVTRKTAGSNGDVDAGAISTDTTHRVAAAWAEDDLAASIDGGAVGTDTSAGIPTVDTFAIGHFSSTGGLQLNGYIDEIVYTPQRDPNATLEALAA